MSDIMRPRCRVASIHALLLLIALHLPAVELSHQGPVRRVLFSPNGRTLGTASDDWKGRLWDVDTGNLIAELPHRGITIDMVFSEDGTLVATSSTDATVKLWDGETGTLLHQLDSTSDGLSVDSSPV